MVVMNTDGMTFIMRHDDIGIFAIHTLIRVRAVHGSLKPWLTVVLGLRLKIF